MGMLVKRIFLMICVLVSIECEALCEEAWQDMTRGIKDTDLKDTDLKVIAVDPAESTVVFVGARDKLYKSIDGGVNWTEIFTVYGDGEIKSIAISRKNPKIVYIATSNGLFKTLDRGENWARVFKGIGDREKGINFAAIHPFDSEMIYIGSAKGLFSSKDGGGAWHKTSGLAGSEEINFIAIDPAKADTMYISTAKGVFKTTNMGKDWERIFVTIRSGEAGEPVEEDDSEIEEEEVSAIEVNCISISSFDHDKIYLGTKKGVFLSSDSGKSWKKLSSTGLESENIKHIVSSRTSHFIYAATDKGVFGYDESSEAWQKFYGGITTNGINMLAFDFNQEHLWVVGDGGVFKMFSQEKDVKGNVPSLEAIFKNEPAIREIQEAAIKYAEVENGKIKNWRIGAACRGLFPEFRVNYDKTISYSKNDFWVGPYDWSADLTWDLADIIWNPYQKDIDVRSRLMVQLRDDILNEVTHLYYERRRLQAELITSPPSDAKTKFEKELRLEELTANIDGLTNGYLSKRLCNLQ